MKLKQRVRNGFINTFKYFDYLITDEEFEAAINKLKANKSLGVDNILPYLFE